MRVRGKQEVRRSLLWAEGEGTVEEEEVGEELAEEREEGVVLGLTV